MSPQFIPAGKLEIIPVPPPPRITVTGYSCVISAPIARSALRTTAHGSVPTHADPVQPSNDVPGVGMAVKVTLVAGGNAAVQVEPQSIPAGLEIIFPTPDPLILAETVAEDGGGGAGEKLAVTV